jgi:hypothetical protein
MPVADMLAHSPLVPIVIDYSEAHDTTAEDEEETMPALRQRDRVRVRRVGLTCLL